MSPNHQLRVVDNERPAAPYPADTGTKGWELGFQPERYRNSDTYATTTDEMRPWQLMSWVVAWTQTPAGSLPNDDTLIAAHMGMPLQLFQLNRSMLLRKWVLCDDGRWYHPVLVEKVLTMIEMRAGMKKRQAEHRAKLKGSLSSNVTRDKPVTNAQSPVSLPPEPEPEPTRSKAICPVSPDASPPKHQELQRQALDIRLFLNAKTGRAFRSKVDLELIVARLKDGATPQECKAVIARKTRDWKGDEKMDGFLRPATLFGRKNFAQYLGEVPPEDANAQT